MLNKNGGRERHLGYQLLTELACVPFRLTLVVLRLPSDSYKLCNVLLAVTAKLVTQGYSKRQYQQPMNCCCLCDGQALKHTQIIATESVEAEGGVSSAHTTHRTPRFARNSRAIQAAMTISLCREAAGLFREVHHRTIANCVLR